MQEEKLISPLAKSHSEATNSFSRIHAAKIWDRFPLIRDLRNITLNWDWSARSAVVVPRIIRRVSASAGFAPQFQIGIQRRNAESGKTQFGM